MHSSGWTQTQQTALPMMQSRDTASTTMLPRDSIRWPIQRSVITLMKNRGEREPMTCVMNRIDTIPALIHSLDERNTGVAILQRKKALDLLMLITFTW